jgi:cytoskeletal protein RodZ
MVSGEAMNSFGARLRHERERRQIALKSIAERTKISVRFLEGLERDDLSRWPGGVFRKSFVRAYAVCVGLDADVVVREFIELYPDPHEPARSNPPIQQAAIQQSQPSRGFALQTLLVRLQKRWLDSRLPGLPAWFRSSHTSGYDKDAIAAIMKVEER